MTNTLEDYIKIYPTLDREFCEKIRSELEEVSWKQHVFYNSDGQYVTQSGNRELDVSWDEIPSRPDLTQKVWETISKYILEDHKNPYFNGWAGFTNIRFNRYHPDRLMALHCDHIHDMFDGQRKGIPTLTVLGLHCTVYHVSPSTWAWSKIRIAGGFAMSMYVLLPVRRAAVMMLI